MLITTYIVIIFLFHIYEAVIGVGVDLDGHNNPGVTFCAFWWPISIPVLLIMKFSNILNKIKKKRLDKEKSELQLKEKLKFEYDKAMEEINK